MARVGNKLSISASGLKTLIQLLAKQSWFVGKKLDDSSISSQDIREYILGNNLHPQKLFPACFSEDEPNAPITYQWTLSIQDILSYLGAEQFSEWGADAPKDLSQLRLWIDILFIDQVVPSSFIACSYCWLIEFVFTFPAFK